MSAVSIEQLAEDEADMFIALYREIHAALDEKPVQLERRLNRALFAGTLTARVVNVFGLPKQSDMPRSVRNAALREAITAVETERLEGSEGDHIAAHNAAIQWAGNAIRDLLVSDRPQDDVLDLREQLRDAIRGVLGAGPWAVVAERAADAVMGVVTEQPDDAAPSPAEQGRCPFCDHEQKFHDAEGRCLFTVDHGVPGSNLVCPCAPAREQGEQQPAAE